MWYILKYWKALLLLAINLVSTKNNVIGWPLYMESLTEAEKVSIDHLRQRMGEQLTTEYMEEDVYLAKWLAAKNFSVDHAAQLLQDNLLWRQQHKLDTILEEDWSEMENEFPYERDTKDRLGRPILYFYFGQWNIHKLITEEDSLVTLGRYMMKVMEESDQHVRRLRKEEERNNNHKHPSPVTQFSMIINFDGYDIWNQGCFQCLAFYRGFGQTLESHYPRSVERVILVNVPTAFEVVFWYIEAILAEKTRGSVKLYGSNRRVWEPALLSWVSKDQIPGDLVELPKSPYGDDYITTRETEKTLKKLMK